MFPLISLPLPIESLPLLGAQEVVLVHTWTVQCSRNVSQSKGAAVDKDNNVYAVNYGSKYCHNYSCLCVLILSYMIRCNVSCLSVSANTDLGTIGRFFPNGTSELWYSSAQPSTFTSLKFDAMGNLYVGDVQNKRVLRISPSKSVVTFCSDATMLDGVPGDMTLANNGNLFVTGNNIQSDSGEIWLCDTNGTASKLKGNLFRTNGEINDWISDSVFRYRTFSKRQNSLRYGIT